MTYIVYSYQHGPERGARPTKSSVPPGFKACRVYLQQDLQSPLQHSAHLALQHSAQDFLVSAWAEKLHPSASKASRRVFIVVLS
jgi:hypothetical protein